MKTPITHREYALFQRREKIVEMLKKRVSPEYICFYFNTTKSRISQIKKEYKL